MPVIPPGSILTRAPQVGDYVTLRPNQEVLSVLSPDEAVIRCERVASTIDFGRPGLSQTFHEETTAVVAVKGVDSSKLYDGAKLTVELPVLFTGTTKNNVGDTLLVAEPINPNWFYIESVDAKGQATTRPYKP